MEVRPAKELSRINCHSHLAPIVSSFFNVIEVHATHSVNIERALRSGHIQCTRVLFNSKQRCLLEAATKSGGPFGSALRADCNELLLSKLSDALELPQKRRFVGNLLQRMKNDGEITVDRPGRWGKWRLTKNS